jgi:hypothetical protein
MGKMIQTIAMILNHRPKLQHTQLGTKHNPTAEDLDKHWIKEGLWDSDALD